MNLQCTTNSNHLFYQKDNIGLKLNTLPLELFQLILSNLKPDDYQESNTICKLWNVALINNAKQQQLDSIKDFAEWVNLILADDHQEIQKNLNEVVTGTEIFESMSLLKVKMFDLSEEIILILKNLDLDVLKYLEFEARTDKKPKYFKDLLFLTISYKKIEIEIKIAETKSSHQWKKSDPLAYLFDELITQGFKSQALLMMKLLADDGAKNFIYKIVNKNQNQILLPHLPFDALTTLFSFLDAKTWQKTVLVNKLWSVSTIEGAKIKETCEMENFIEKLADNLDTHPDQKNQLKNAALKSNIIMQSTTLLDIRPLKTFLKENTLIILKTLKVKDLHELNLKIGKSKLFSLAHIYKRIDTAMQTPYDDVKSHQLKNICLDMVRTCYFDEAINVVKKISVDQDRDDVLVAISDGLVSFDEFNKALTVLGGVSDEKTKTTSIKKISNITKGIKNE